MAVTFDAAAKNVREARTAEELFGIDAGLARAAYATLARALHPDHNGGSKESTDAFVRLQSFWDTAARRIATDTYGGPYYRITGKEASYDLDRLIAKGDVADVWRAFSSDDGEFAAKVVRAPRNNDLITHEYRTIRLLREKAQIPQYFPDPVDVMGVRLDGGIVRRAAVYGHYRPEEWPTLRQVIEAYPEGLDPRDMAWIWRRLLTALGMVHELGIVHGHVFPDHILVHPTMHGLVLCDWTGSVVTGSHLPFRFKNRAYPVEVSNKEYVTAATDICMGAIAMVQLTKSAWIEAPIPPAIRAHFASAITLARDKRPDDAFRMRDSFDEIIEALWGPRMYRPLAWPRDHSRT